MLTCVISLKCIQYILLIREFGSFRGHKRLPLFLFPELRRSIVRVSLYSFFRMEYSAQRIRAEQSHSFNYLKGFCLNCLRFPSILIRFTLFLRVYRLAIRLIAFHWLIDFFPIYYFYYIFTISLKLLIFFKYPIICCH